MGFRFYKSFRLLPGVRINLSKSGVSTSLGVPGATVNLGRGRRRTTIGLPGSGLSYVETQRDGVTRERGRPRRGWLVALTVIGVLLYLFG